MTVATTPLGSRCLAVVDVDRAGMDADLAFIDALPARDTYSEYSFGRWQSHVLANGIGDENDDEFRPHDVAAIPTPLGQRLPAIMGLVEDTFLPDALRWARIFTLNDGLLMPHVDFVEFDAETTRVQVPLRTSPAALHSERESVVHLRRGEVWFLEATVPHAAYSAAGPARIALCLDFAVPPSAIGTCLRVRPESLPSPELVDRPPLGGDELEALLQLGATLDRASLRDVVRLLALVHFRRHAHAAACFDWLIEAARRSGDDNLTERARAFRTYCLHQRAYGERFVW